MPRATGVDTHLSRYEDAWEAINRLIRTGGSWSGFERNCFYVGTRLGSSAAEPAIGDAGNTSRSGFANASAIHGLDFIEDGRGLAVCDFDRDGDPDLLLKNRSGPQLRAIRNDSTGAHGRLAFRLEGTASNRQAIGARVTLRVGETTRVKELRAGSGFLSQNADELFFGVGDAKSVDASVRWPGGKVQSLGRLEPGFAYRVKEGDEKPARAAFRSPSTGGLSAAPPAVAPSPSTSANRRVWLMAPAPLPRLAPIDGDGRPWDWRPFTRGPFVLNLWSPECSVCVRELLEWQEERAGKPSALPVVTMTARSDGARSGASARVIEKVRLPIAFAAPDDLLALSLVVQDVAWWRRELALPCSLLVDGGGRIVRLYEGRVSWTDIEADAATIPRDAAASQRLGLPFAGRYHASDVYRNDFQIGVEFMEAGLPYRALDAFSRTLERRPGDVETYYNSGLVLLELADLQGAREAFTRALRGQPQFVDAIVNLGVVAAREGKLDEAGERFLRVLELRPQHVEALMNLGNVEVSRGRPRRAIERFRQAVRVEPTMGAAHKRIGTAQRRLGDLDAARQSYETATRLDPKDAEAWSNLGVILAETGKLEAGHAACKKSIEIAPRYASAYNNLGLILGALGRAEKAISAFRSAIEIEPESEPAYLNLAREYFRGGQREEARKAAEAVLRFAPSSRGARQILQRLGER